MDAPADAFLFADWPAPIGIRALTTLRTGPGVSPAPFAAFNLGTRSGDAPGNALINRARLAAALELPSAPAWLQQVHGTAVFAAGTADDTGGVEPVADAAVADAGAAVLAVLTADCLPVLFCSDDGQRLGAAHAGWRGLAAGVLEATVAAMAVPPARLLAWLGPAAGPQSYEVGQEVYAEFVTRDVRCLSAFSATRPGHWRVDLYALARLRLHDAGVARVFGGGLCTIADPARFFSHRRDRSTGRMATLIWRSAPGATLHRD